MLFNFFIIFYYLHVLINVADPYHFYTDANLGSEKIHYGSGSRQT